MDAPDFLFRRNWILGYLTFQISNVNRLCPPYDTPHITPIPIMTPNESSPTKPIPGPCHCRVDRAAPVLLFVVPLVLDAKPADTVVVALLVLVPLELTDEVVGFEKILT